MYDLIAIALGLVLALVAGIRARRKPRGSFYAREVYALDPRADARFAAAGIAFVLGSAADFALGGRFAVGLVAVCAVLSILYAASFVRGSQGEDE